MMWRVVLLLGLLGVAGCVPVNQFAVVFRTGPLAWSPVLRPDLEPLTAEQIAQQREVATRFSDGTPESGAPVDSELVSPLYPEVDAVALRRMRNAPVVWVARGTPLRLSYEATARDVTYDHLNCQLAGAPGTWPRVELSEAAYSPRRAQPPVAATLLAASRRGMTDPVTRQFAIVSFPAACISAHSGIFRDPAATTGPITGDLLVSNSGASIGLEYALPDLRIAIERCHDSVARRAGPDQPVALNEDCTLQIVDGTTCSELGRYSLEPVTMIKCRVAVEADTTFRLRYIDPADPSRPGRATAPSSVGPQSPYPVLPHVKVVTGERVLARGLAVTDEECRMPNPAGGPPVACSPARWEALRVARICDGVQRGRLPPRTLCLPRELRPLIGFSSVRANWRFSVGGLTSPGQVPAPMLMENFAPGVVIDHVRVFTATASGERRYMTPAEIRELRINQVRCDPIVEADTGFARFEPGRCATRLPDANPAWNGVPAQADQVLVWSAVFQADAAPTAVVRQRCIPDRRGVPVCTDVVARDVLTRDIAVHEGDRVFIEFHLRG